MLAQTEAVSTQAHAVSSQNQVVSNLYQSDIKARVYLITPTHAEALLRGNTHNRSISQKTVNRYANAMAAGEWQLNGEPIIVNSDGSLGSGQHRLLACVKSGKAFPSLLVEGVSKEAFITMDSGKTRTLSDVMTIEGIANATQAASISRCLVAYEKSGTPDTRVLNDMGVQKRRFLNRYYEDAELIQRGSVIASRLRGKIAGVAKSSVGFCFVIFAGYDEDAAADFFAGVESGRYLAKRDPCYVLRERLLRIGVADRFEMKTVEQCAAFFKAFRAFLHNVEIGPRQLAWRRYGPAAEKFPEI